MGFFDQHVRTGIQERPHDGSMGDCRRAHADDIDGAKKLAPVGEYGDAMGSHRGAARLDARIGNADQLDAFHQCVFRRVMAAERSDPDDSGPQRAETLVLGNVQRESLGKFQGL